MRCRRVTGRPAMAGRLDGGRRVVRGCLLGALALAIAGAAPIVSGAEATADSKTGSQVGGGENAEGPEAAGRRESGGDAARDHLEFSNQFASECMYHRAELRRIANTHPQRVIRVTLVSYLGQTRSQGESVKRLAPGADPAPLGCDASSGLERRWEIVDAEYVDDAD